MAKEATSSPTQETFTRNEVRDMLSKFEDRLAKEKFTKNEVKDMLKQLKDRFDEEMCRGAVRGGMRGGVDYTKRLKNLTAAMSTTAHMLHFKIDEE